MAITLKHKPLVSVGDVDVMSIDYSDYLDTGESLTGTVTVTEIGTTHLTFANQAVTTSAVTILGRSVASGLAAQFKFSGMQANTTYRVRVDVDTDSTPARTKLVDVVIVTASTG